MLEEERARVRVLRKASGYKFGALLCAALLVGGIVSFFVVYSTKLIISKMSLCYNHYSDLENLVIDRLTRVLFVGLVGTLFLFINFAIAALEPKLFNFYYTDFPGALFHGIVPLLIMLKTKFRLVDSPVYFLSQQVLVVLASAIFQRWR